RPPRRGAAATPATAAAPWDPRRARRRIRAPGRGPGRGRRRASRIAPARGQEPEQVREREGRAADARVDAEPDVVREVDRHGGEAVERGRRLLDPVPRRERVETGRGERVDAEDAPAPLVEGHAVL